MNVQAVLELDQLETSKGEKIDVDTTLNGKICLLYFTASWCPPCVQFSPILDEFAGKHSEDVVVIIVSSDHSEQEFESYSSKKPNLFRLPFSSASKADELRAKFGIYALPTVQVLSADGKSLTSWGKSAITRNPSGCVQAWKKNHSGAGILSMMGLW